MSTPLLTTKLYMPARQPNAVPRARLIERLNEGLQRKLTLISAAAGFGKTTLVSEWAAAGDWPVAWLSLDAGDSDVNRFLTYLIAALQTVSAEIGVGVQGALRSPQPPPAEAILTALLNDIASVPNSFILVLDDYHDVEGTAVDAALGFLIDHLPPQIHLVIASREDPHLPLARLRVRGQLTELRATNLRFTPAEAAEFLNRAMGLNLSDDNIAALETRTEGWIAGLQLAAISMQGHEDATGFIQSFTGSHRFVLDYLMEEVLRQQPEDIQNFLLNTSVLGRMCGPLCDAVVQNAARPGQDTLEYLEHANLFIVPLDNERRWYRYHHLFSELLRQRLHQSAGTDVADVHVRASDWFEREGLDLEAFQHAAAANDVERAERLINGKETQLHARGGALPVLNWLHSLPPSVLDARPALWVTFASALSIIGKTSEVEEKLNAADSALQGMEPGGVSRALLDRIAEMRSLVGLLAADPQTIEDIIAGSGHVLQHPQPDNLSIPPFILWKLALAHQYRGNRIQARKAFIQTIAACETLGNVHVNILAATGLGKSHEQENQLHQAAETFRRALHLAGDPPGPAACEAHAGLARTLYEWNDLEAARPHAQQSLALARQVEIASFVSSVLALTRLQLTQGDVDGAIALLSETAAEVLQARYAFRTPEVAAAQVLALLHRGDLPAAERIAREHHLPRSLARVHLAQGDTTAALAQLEPLRRRMEEQNRQDDLLKALVVQSLAYQAHGDIDAALQVLGEALEMAQPGGFIRTFIDEGPPMVRLLTEAQARGVMPEYTATLLAACGETAPVERVSPPPLTPRAAQPLVEPLTERELEILQLISHGLSNIQIADRLYLALSTVKGHNRNIFGKLQVQRRTEALARARELGLLSN